MTPAPDTHAAITKHLYDHDAVGGVKYQSSLMAILNDARAAADRDDKGHVRPGEPSDSWLAATGYLVLLDQVGTCFKISGNSVTAEPAVIHALKNFSHVQDDPTVEALYALRCALAHDYSLFNVNKNPMRTHSFTFVADETSPLVRMPTSPWDGSYENLAQAAGRGHETWVNLREVGNLAEDVVARLRTEHEAGRLAIRLELTEFELRYRMYFPVL